MVDTGRPGSCRVGEGLILELVWGEVIEGGMSTLSIREEITVVII